MAVLAVHAGTRGRGHEGLIPPHYTRGTCWRPLLLYGTGWRLLQKSQRAACTLLAGTDVTSSSIDALLAPNLPFGNQGR